eukprot:CAMPEP_0204899276 /NCGR_PEP_ID=MMETSP1397-20131031/1766_1 /ASSEMBLY_ACC=CAM_ASM_000891 /TAXON_ID=49980 /ORGANISM="Climacostomum Climacostomum virens, Strain Stock W-24" /LENGTH=483 /DNA_ID=CAMNT_0052067223 /DNA_START=189 /DNA_END=1637 /DNA_ORIENTATION=+
MDKKVLVILGLALNLLMLLSLLASTPIPSATIRRKSWQNYERSPDIPYLAAPSWSEYTSRGNFIRNHQKIERQENYCTLVKEWQDANPLQLAEDGSVDRESRQIYSDYPAGNLVQGVLHRNAKLVNRGHTIHMDKVNVPWEPLDPSIRIFYHKTPGWHLYHRIGSEFLCEGQRYNHIPGHEHIINKDEFARLNYEYGQYYASRPQCFQAWEFMPLTYDLNRQGDCEAFLEELEADNDLKRIKWIRKKARNSHNAEGVDIVDKSLALSLIAKYKDSCPDKKHYIAQKYISDPLLVDGKKFDFRIYMLVANVKPLMVLYHDGFLRVSMVRFDSYSQEAYAHITNTALAKDYVKERDDAEELLEEQMWTMKEFEDYMIEQGFVEEGWLANFVRPYMRKAMLHISRMAYPNFMHHPGVFELYGVDFMFDSKLHLWFLEINRSPAMQATTEEKGRIQGNLVKQMLDIEFAVLAGQGIDKAVEESEFEW